ncbi:uncharacterized protein LOC132277424 [Cornus florida]|uniref:uncharacterized protein LOC132277424 n=1 Tax=Cornus florida TaxID=4283 RepID=UPI0028A216C2|nr:uncharacterized protein LOC132277424 [Cornus florida]
MAIKGQVVADFLLECDVDEPDECLEESSWQLFVDGSSNQMGVGIGINVPRAIVMDNGTNLDSKQVNGQAEITNRTIFACINKKLEEEKGKWLDELPNILWAYRTTLRRPTRESPFSIAYGTEAVIEHQVPTIRSLAWNQERNDHMLKFYLNLLEEKRNAAAIRLTSYQQTLMNSHNRKVRDRGFAPGDLVLKRKVDIIKKMLSP